MFGSLDWKKVSSGIISGETYPNNAVKLRGYPRNLHQNMKANCKWDANIPSWKVCEKRCCAENRLSAIDAIALDLLTLHPYQSPSLALASVEKCVDFFYSNDGCTVLQLEHIARKNAINFWFDISILLCERRLLLIIFWKAAFVWVTPYLVQLTFSLEACSWKNGDLVFERWSFFSILETCMGIDDPYVKKPRWRRNWNAISKMIKDGLAEGMVTRKLCVEVLDLVLTSFQTSFFSGHHE